MKKRCSEHAKSAYPSLSDEYSTTDMKKFDGHIGEKMLKSSGNIALSGNLDKKLCIIIFWRVGVNRIPWEMRGLGSLLFPPPPSLY